MVENSIKYMLPLRNKQTHMSFAHIFRISLTLFQVELYPLDGHKGPIRHTQSSGVAAAYHLTSPTQSMVPSVERVGSIVESASLPLQRSSCREGPFLLL